MATLKKEREKYNANDIGYYNGGLPVKGRGAIRGRALGNPGEFHSPQFHNFKDYNHQDTAMVTSEDAIKFKHWMGSDKVDFNRTQPYYPMYYDRNLEFMRDRKFWLVIFMKLIPFSYCF